MPKLLAEGALILMYHRLGDGVLTERESGENSYAVSEDVFRAHIELLSRYPVIPLSQISVAKPFSVVITFDDGNATDYTVAFPILARHNLPATFFITPSLVGRPGYLTWPQVTEMANAGMEIGAHGLEHRPLGLLEEEKLHRDLREARRWIDSETGGKTMAMALPFGDGGDREIKAAFVEGYSVVCGSTFGVARSVEGNTALPRFAVRRDHPLGDFEGVIRRGPIHYTRHALRHWSLCALKCSVGRSGYERIRRVWMGRLTSKPWTSGDREQEKSHTE